MGKTIRAEQTYTRRGVAGFDDWCQNGWASWLHQVKEDLDRESYEPLSTEQEADDPEYVFVQ